MTSRVGAGLTGLVAASFAAGCSQGDSLIAPTKGPPTVSFMTADQSTGVGAVSIWITDGGYDVPLDLANSIARNVNVATWPGDVGVPSSQMVATFPRLQYPNGAERLAYAQIDIQLDATIAGNAWFAVSLPERPGEYQLQGADSLFAFDGGARGVRVSPVHPPVVASVMACAKEPGVVVYAQFSELVTKAAGALTLDYGNPAAPCSAGGEGTGEDQFLCANATEGQPFSLHIVGLVTAQASGLPMAPGTLRSSDMQMSVTADGCSLYKPAIAD
jgi:hypothetical protein